MLEDLIPLLKSKTLLTFPDMATYIYGGLIGTQHPPRPRVIICPTKCFRYHNKYVGEH